MSERTPFLAGNWKMEKTRPEAGETARRLRDLVGDVTDRDVALFPPLTALDAVRRAVEGCRIRVGAQNCHFEGRGAFTGEVSARMLRDAGCDLVLVGHSERRHIFGETDKDVHRKLSAALEAGLDPVLCLGELLGERQAGRAEEAVRVQLTTALSGLEPTQIERVTIAYEPVWAIGTDHTATPEQAQEMHAHIRGILAEIQSQDLAERVRIQYGGSVKPGNIAGLMAKPDLDGALVGGASLDPEGFAAIVRFDRGW